LAKGFGILGFLPKLQKTFSNKLAKGLGKLGNLASPGLPGAYLRGPRTLGISISRDGAPSPARAKRSRFPSHGMRLPLSRALLRREE